MSFLTVLEKDATMVENAVVDSAKKVLDYVDNVVVHDILPVLEQALLAAIGKLGQEGVSALLASGAAPEEPVV